VVLVAGITMMVGEVILSGSTAIRMIRKEAGRNDEDGEIEVVENSRSGG
jgi:hypothetical protein